MKRLACWTLTVAAGVLLGALGGTVLGALLFRFSYDYVLVPEEIARWGLQVGLLSGALIAAVQVTGERLNASPARALFALLGSMLLGTLGCALGAALGYGAYRVGLLPTRQWGLPNPTRHAMTLGVMVGASVGVVVGLTGGAVFVARARGIPRAKCLRWGGVGAIALLAVIGCRPTTLVPVGPVSAIVNLHVFTAQALPASNGCA